MRVSGKSYKRIARHARCGLSIAGIILSLHLAGFGQSPTPTPTTVQNDRPDSSSKAPAPNENIKRWLDIDALSVATRCRFIENRAGITVSNQQQFQVVAKGRFKFDRNGKYSVYAGVFTGNAFTGGWNNTGLGTGDFQSNLFVKQLYFDAKPVKTLEVQVGGLAINNGENTEVVAYDNDGYIMGGRVLLRHPKKVYFDEVSATFAHIGDTTRPNVFRRFKHLENLNYHQFLVRKQVNKHVSFSADYTFEAGRDFLHEAVRFKALDTPVLDTILVESYQRVDGDRGAGFNLYGEKTFWKKFTAGGGFAHVEHPLLNGDRYPQGNRLYLTASYKITPEFALSTALIRGISGMPTPLTHRTRFEIIFAYNVLETLHRLRIL